MAVKVRLRRTGRKNRPYYRLVVADSRQPRDGRFIDSLGHYDPRKDPAEVEINEEKVMEWLGKGVQMSDTVRSILSREGILKRLHESRFPAKKKAAPGGKTTEEKAETPKKRRGPRKAP
jgi:small subunit ribosomal protein S16